MYIKAVTIHGFKSYKDPTTIELSAACNVVVGRNGAGKSNFFAAIRFVLGDIFTNLRPEERQALLHEGAGLAVMSAFVEVVFDNSDNRFPIDREEVVLRRSIGLKKDEYFLDKKHVTKSDVGNLLESAGFSKSNPYYIVQQGKITSLTLMKDPDRLELLKEVAGCKVYDERRQESERIMKDTESRREKVVEVVTYIEDRLRELEDEKEELREFQSLDREKRALEYTIYDQELKAARTKLQRLEVEKVELAEQLKGLHDRSSHRDSKTQDLEVQLKAVIVEEQASTKEKRALATDTKAVVKNRTRLELDLQESAEQQRVDAVQKATLQKELEEVSADIAATEIALQDIQPRYESELDTENQVKEKLADAERELHELYSKQGRHEQFGSKDDRDKWLKQEIKQMRSSLKDQEAQIATVDAEVKGLALEKQNTEDGLAEKSTHQTALRQEIEEDTAKHHDLRIRRDEASNERKELWRGKEEIVNKRVACTEEISKQERMLSTAIGRDAHRGLEAIKQLVASKKIPAMGIYGPLIELFDVDEKFITAVEVTGGGSLSHVVVDTEATASRIVSELNKQKLGRVTFMPLEQLAPNAMEASPGPASDVISMMSRLKFDQKFQGAFKQVFGKTLIARDAATATTYARQHKVNCVTLDGDQVNKRGAITGGFIETGRSRLLAMKKIKATTQRREELEVKLAECQSRLTELDGELANILASMQRVKADERVKRQTLESLKKELESDQSRVAKSEDSLQEKQKLLKQLQESARALTKDTVSMGKEVGTELVTSLSGQEQLALRELNQEVTVLRKQLPLCQQKRVALETKKASIETRLQDNLRKRQAELHLTIGAIGSDSENQGGSQASAASTAAKVERLQTDLAATQEEEVQLQERQKAAETHAKINAEKRAKLTQEIDQLKKEETGRDESLEVTQRKMDALLSKRATLTSKKTTCMAKIRELGSLPADAFDKYADSSSAVLLKKLKKNNEKLQKYAHVNKKALDQYVNFTEQRDQLQLRLEELDAGKDAIVNLITVLDQRKDEAIQRTFKGVSQHFTQVFHELVPSGKATLVMIKKRQRDGGGVKAAGGPSENQAVASAASSGVLQYGGVAIKVSFTGTGEVYLLNQLSGGQKSVVALAFIFAIQRLDPAPFYLFDEIDANLDAAHRTAVANLIQKFTVTAAQQSQNTNSDSDTEVSETAQFICTTFRPELVTSADQCYGVYHRHKVSNINTIDAEQAMQFISHEQEAAPAAADVRPASRA